MDTLQSDFRLHLQNEFVKKCKINPQFSLRAFARQLDIHPTTLSQILAGKRPITKKRFSYIADKVHLSPAQHEKFLKNFATKKKKKPAQKEQDQHDYKQLTIDSFSIIADWYHFAILQLLEVKGFKQDPRWIAKSLNIRINEVKIAIERLKRVGLITVTKRGKWIDTSEGFTTTVHNQFTNSALRNLQKQVLNMALNALDEVTIEERDQTSITMSLNSKRLPEIKSMIKDFRRKLISFVNQDKVKDCVYQAGISIYPLTKRRKNHET
jgi:uncharacterized protein (TIGR02147 family)